MSLTLHNEEAICSVLASTFGFTGLRPGQLEVIQDLLQGKPVISVMPTGAGKSLCYQLPAALLAQSRGLTLVVSPLIALMKDQVDSLQSRGIRTAALTSAASSMEQTEILQDIRKGNYDIVYVAPERFHSGRFMSALQDMPNKLALLAIDEAHCISEWGHDFRPAYRLLGRVIQDLQPERTLAVTATATPEVRVDIGNQLGMQDPILHVRGFARPTLTFSVEHSGGPTDKSKRVVEKIKALTTGCALVYAATRKNAERYASDLAEAGVCVRAYHAGLEDKHRSAVQDQFMNGDVDVIVATNAFGMGVDKVDVRLVIHADLPRSIEAYYQEAGRAGRDGLPADCVLLFNHSDVRLQEFLIAASFPSAILLRTLWKVLRERPGISQHELGECKLPGDPHDSTISSAVRILARHGYVIDDRGILQAVQPKQLSGTYPAFDPDAPARREAVETAKLKIMIEYSYHAACRHGFVLDYFGDQRQELQIRQQCQACDNCQGVGVGEELSEAQLDQAQKLLSVVAELGGRFGRKRIATIANGSDDDERFFGIQHRGALSGVTQAAILDLLRALEAGRLIEQSRGEYPTIAITRSGKQVAAGTADLDPELLRLMPSAKTRKSKARSATPTVPGNPAVADGLRQLRSDLAKEQSVPAYVIFSNRTLDELSVAQPVSLKELDTIHGIGPSRRDRYGEAILTAIGNAS